MRFEFDRDCDHNLINKLKISERSRDDIDHALLVLKCLYKEEEAMGLIMTLMGGAHRRIAATDNGRPGDGLLVHSGAHSSQTCFE